ncbi:MFS transporter [Kineococcus rubinsiae]|uniref:MFS transporter n=1 Tax=Kineococcus rubinsiae TaxID=2609562 RepID=UPI0014319891|nr:MFS transporter [Kineococcus rubinsiae]
MLRTPRACVATAYAAQGFGYAVLLTDLPQLKARQGLDDTAVALVVLLVCAAAAGGSVLAGRIAAARGSRAALLTGLLVQAAALPLVALPSSTAVLLAALAGYGTGLGLVDAAAGMQGVLVQQLRGRPVMGGFFAASTGAAVAGALVVSAGAKVPGGGAGTTLLVAAGVALTVAVLVRGSLVRGSLVRGGPVPGGRAPVTGRRAASAGLPRGTVAVFGGVVLAAFAVDSSVSTWSSVYLGDHLGTSAAVAPLGYAAYQAATLLTRLATDRLVLRTGRARLVGATTGLAVLGCAAVAALPTTGAAVAGFALAGVGVGALVPLAFSAAGEAAGEGDASRSDAVVARVNLASYPGSVLGAVLVGALAAVVGLGPAFALPAVLLVPVVLLAARFQPRPVTVALPGDAVLHRA